MKPKLLWGDLIKLKDIAHRNYINLPPPNGGTTEHWYDAVVEFIESCKGQIVPRDLSQLEQALIRQGLAKEYLASLLDVVGYKDTSDEERILSLITASCEQRQEAINKIIHLTTDSNICKQLNIIQLRPK